MSSFDIRPIFDGVLLYCEYFRRIVNVANISSRFDLFTAFVLHCKDRIIYSLKTVFIEPKSPPPLHLRMQPVAYMPPPSPPLAAATTSRRGRAPGLRRGASSDYRTPAPRACAAGSAHGAVP